MTDQDMVALATGAGTLGMAQQFSRDRYFAKYAIDQIQYKSLGRDSHFAPRLAQGVLNDQASAISRAVRSGVVIYSIDAKGLQ